MQRSNVNVGVVTSLVLVVVGVTYIVWTGSVGTRKYLDEKAVQIGDQLRDSINSLRKLKAKDDVTADVTADVPDDVIGNPRGITMFKHVPMNIGGVTDPARLEEIFVKHADRVDLSCGEVKRLGHKGDGGWNMCQDNNYTLKNPCLVYSFGISTDWSFDEQVAREHGCTVRAFDPSINLPNHTHGEEFPVQFYNLGLGGEDFTNPKKWPIRKFSTMYNDLEKGKKPIIDFLKMDIESSEYLSLIAMEKEGMLKYIKQIAFESHVVTFGIRKGVELLHVLERNGFRKWSAHVNMLNFYKSKYKKKMSLSCCYEFSYINTNFLDKSTATFLSIVAPYGYNAFD